MAPLIAAAPLIGLIGAGVGAAGTVLGGIAQGNAASYQAQVAQNNATIEQNNAKYAVQAGQARAQATSLKNAAAGGAVKAAQAASGIDVNTGSAVDVQKTQRELGQLDTETVLNNSELQAYGYRSAATSYSATAGLEETEAAQAPIGAAIGATGNLLSNASSLGLNWAKLGQGTSAVGDQTVAQVT